MKENAQIIEENTQIDEALHGVKLQSATSEATGQWGTYGTSGGKVPKRVKSPRERFLDWLISWLLPGFHLAKNPPKGVTKMRKKKEDELWGVSAMEMRKAKEVLNADS